MAHPTNDTEIIKASQETFAQYVHERLRQAVRFAMPEFHASSQVDNAPERKCAGSTFSQISIAPNKNTP